MTGWGKPDLPYTASRLTYVYGALVVGSQAVRYASDLPPDPAKDWDLMVPFARWRSAVASIPKTAVPNGNRGWRFERRGVGFDVWPDELARYLDEATSPHRVRAKPGPAYAVDLVNSLVYVAHRKC